MAKQKFRYNQDTCQFEPILPSGKRFFKRFMVYIIAGIITALPAVYLYHQTFSSLLEQQLLKKHDHLTKQWDGLTSEIEAAYNDLETLAKKDDQYYRTLLDLKPLPTTVREAGIGGAERFVIPPEEIDLVKSNYEHLEKLKNQVEVAKQSFNQLRKATTLKNSKLASRPAIQPISNKHLRTLHLTFGQRMHPIFNVYTDHKGLDFSAGFGTPVYATGDGRVSMSYYSSSYGNVVYVDHGFNYETRYAHLQKFNVQAGNYVKRGDIIGYVGNTGISAAPHLHYEVFYKGNAVNPIYFFQRDLSLSEYQKIIQSKSGTGVVKKP